MVTNYEKPKRDFNPKCFIGEDRVVASHHILISGQMGPAIIKRKDRETLPEENMRRTRGAATPKHMLTRI